MQFLRSSYVKIFAVLLIICTHYSLSAKTFIIQGIVTDTASKAIDGAKITIMNNYYRVLTSGYTDTNGRFTLPISIKKLDKALIEITPKFPMIKVLGTLSAQRLMNANKELYNVTQTADTVHVFSRIRSEQIKKRENSNELTINCGVRVNIYSIPKMMPYFWRIRRGSN